MMTKLTKASVLLIPIGFVISCVGGAIMASSPQPIDDDYDSDVEYTSTDVTWVNDDSGINTKTFGQDEANSIVLNCTAADINIYHSENYSIQSDYFLEKKFSVKQEDGVISVDYQINQIGELSGISGGDISIGIPRTCKSIIIKCNAGEVEVEGFMGNSLDISTYCGNIEINNSTVSESCKISNTLGNIGVYSSKINGLEAKINSGNLDVYNTMLSGTNTAKVDAGNAEFSLDGYPSDYTIKASVKVGEIDCDYNLNDYTISNNTIDISVITGNCSIEYYDND